MRNTIILLVIALLMAACGDDDSADTTVAAGETTTTAATTSTAAAETTTTAAAASTTTAAPVESTTTTTTTTIAPSPGRLALSRVIFSPVPYLTITNIGNGPTELGAHWLCQRPAYKQLPELVLEPGDTVAIGLGTESPPDLVEYVAVLEVGPAIGPLSKDGGEIGLYTDPLFDSPSAIVDYVEWGSAGHGRADVAILAGIWLEGDFVELPPEATSMSSSGAGGPGVADWFVDIGG